MNNVKIFTLLTIFVPIIGAFTIPILSFSPNFKTLSKYWACVIAFFTALLPFFLIPYILSGSQLIFGKHLYFGINFTLNVDALSVFVSMVSSVISAFIVLYSLHYIKETDNQSEYYFMVLLFIGAMMGLVYSANLIFLYVFWEIAGICSWRLIGFYRTKEFIIKADKAFLMTFLGAVLMLIGFLQIYHTAHTFDITKMKGTEIPISAVLLILAGMFSKSATFPLHSWLPDAGIAPSTVTALLHAAVLVKIGVYVFSRLFCDTFVLPHISYPTIAIIAVFSSLVAAGAAAVDYDMKRILAYSTISQIGYIFLGFSVMNPLGFAGATFYILAHGVSKAGLFLGAGIIEHNTHTRDIRKLGGLIKQMPLTAIAFLMCAFATIGLPPFSGFFAKFMVIMGAVKAGETGIAALALFIALLTMFYLFRLFSSIFLGKPKQDMNLPVVKERSPLMVATIIIFACFAFFTGIFVKYPMKIVNSATYAMVHINNIKGNTLTKITGLADK